MSEYIERIVKATAKRAKVLFDKYQFTWGGEVPSLERLEAHILELIEHLIEFKSRYISGGRITVIGDYTEDDDLEEISICFNLGEVPYLYLYEEYGAEYYANQLEEENARAKK